jgi:hypothetical protein
MTADSMTGKTTSMTARTQSFAHRHHQPSVRALAARSWSQVRRLTGDEYRTALAKHFEAFPPLGGAACRR